MKQGPANASRTGDQGQRKGKPDIPAWMVETNYEAQEIQGQRQHPQEWDNRDVLAEFVGDGQQQNRSASRKQKPEKRRRESKTENRKSRIG